MWAAGSCRAAIGQFAIGIAFSAIANPQLDGAQDLFLVTVVLKVCLHPRGAAWGCWGCYPCWEDDTKGMPGPTLIQVMEAAILGWTWASAVPRRDNFKSNGGVKSTDINKNYDSRFWPIVFLLIPTQPWSSSWFPFHIGSKMEVFSPGDFSLCYKALKCGIWMTVLSINPCGALRCYRR